MKNSRSVADAFAQIPPYGTASVLALLLLGALELSVVPGYFDPGGVLLLVCLILVSGSLHGLALRLAFLVLRPFARAFQVAAWGGLAFGAFALLAQRLGAFTRLDGPYRQLSLLVLFGCSAGAVATTLALSLLQPTRLRPRGVVFACRPAIRAAAFPLLAAAGAAALYADHRIHQGLYPQAHAALRWFAWSAFTFALALALASARLAPLARSPRLRALRRFAWVAPLLAAAAMPLLARANPQGVSMLALRPWSSSLFAAAKAICDFDGDGYSAWLGGDDCDEFNPKVNAGAREIPGNGIDDNCRLGDASPEPEAAELPPIPDEPSPYDVVLVTVDSWRPDHLGIYNPKYGRDGRNTTPNLDAWARDAVVFENAYTPGGWTSIAIASVMRGRSARRLEWTRYMETTRMRLVRERDLKKAKEHPRQMFPLAFRDPSPTLATLLRRRGMRTVAVVDDGASMMLTRGLGVEIGFDSYRQVELWLRDRTGDPGVVELARRELERAPKRERLFLWLHFFGPHDPNHLNPGTHVYGTSLADGYDHELRFLDEQLPVLFSAIERRKKPTVVVITGDHGEHFAEPLRLHGVSATEAELRVPLLLRVPGWSRRRVEQVVSTLDLVPTLLSITGTPAPANLDGIDLTPWARDGAPPAPRVLLSDTWRFDARGKALTDLITVFDGSRKIVFDALGHAYTAYDQRLADEVPLRVDPARDRKLLDVLHLYLERTGGALVPRR